MVQICVDHNYITSVGLLGVTTFHLEVLCLGVPIF